MKTFFVGATENGTVTTPTKSVLYVGSILTVVNYGRRIFLHGNIRALEWIKFAITHCVFYCVATYGGAGYAIRHGKKNEPRKST